ncbi:MAG: uncharacterized protein QOJ00_2616 [Actinomycetota bacterium]|jgi:uncharacterized membrane protein YraQ (UPF0718 family)/YHS domain-containing protein
MTRTGAFGPDVWEAVKMAFFMMWETLWALVLGFGLSGVVQAFVPRESMERRFGRHNPRAVVEATGLGMISSSCSYAATAMAKSLFQKGADFLTAMVFMFASTNLVLELGIVLFVLMGWKFALAEFIGGPIMIVLLVLIGAVVFTRRATEAARERLVAAAPGAAAHEHGLLRSRAAWSDAARYTLADLTMLRKELVIGYGVAGVITVFVSHDVWNKVFFVGHGVWTPIENAIVGPFIAIVSFVCSIGNVPLAAALWHGGLGFGGVVAFIFADLITLPLLLIYRKYYGTALTLKLLAVFWIVMVIAGLAVHGLFSLAHAVPAPPFHGDFAHPRFSWNYTTYLNFIFLAVFAGILWLSRRSRESSSGYAIDPVCGMQVQTANAPAHRRYAGHDAWFCSDRCAERFDREPEKYLQGGGGLDDRGDDAVPISLGLTRDRHEVDHAED